MSETCRDCKFWSDGGVLCNDVCPGWPPTEKLQVCPTVDLGAHAHRYDPCTYCGTPHDKVAPGDCPSR